MKTKFNFIHSNWFYVLILLFYLVVAYNSSGFNHWDEHYQIVEFANYKLDRAYPGELAWEFNARIRPGLQPLLCYLILKPMIFFGWSDPFIFAFLLRAISSLASIAIVRKYVLANQDQVSTQNFPVFILLSFFLWFIPYLSIRFSSENWSGMFYILALSYIYKRANLYNSKTLLCIGICLGLSILFRYQSAILVAGVIGWFIIVKKLPVSKLSLISVGVLMMLILGALADRWLYGEYCFTMLNYFKVNLIDGVAATFGTSPWYHIILYIFTGPGFMLGVLLFTAIILFCYFKPKHVIVWSAIPFLVVHSIIAHKELRFLYPLIHLIPFVLIVAWQEVVFLSFSKNKAIKWSIAAVLIIINLTGLWAINLKGAGLGRIALAEKIYRQYGKKKINLIYYSYADPYTDWIPPRNTFYRNKDVDRTELGAMSKREILAKIRQDEINLLAIPTQLGKDRKNLQLLDTLKFAQWSQSIPDLLEGINDLYDPSIQKSGITVYILKNQN